MKAFSFDEYDAQISVYPWTNSGPGDFTIEIGSYAQTVNGFEILKLAKKVKKFLRKQGLLDDSSK